MSCATYLNKGSHFEIENNAKITENQTNTGEISDIHIKYAQGFAQVFITATETYVKT